MGNICNSEGTCCGNQQGLIEQRDRQQKRRIDKKLKSDGIFENVDEQTAAESEFDNTRQIDPDNPFERTCSNKRQTQGSFRETPQGSIVQATEETRHETFQ